MIICWNTKQNHLCQHQTTETFKTIKVNFKSFINNSFTVLLSTVDQKCLKIYPIWSHPGRWTSSTSKDRSWLWTWSGCSTRLRGSRTLKDLENGMFSRWAQLLVIISDFQEPGCSLSSSLKSFLYVWIKRNEEKGGDSWKTLENSINSFWRFFPHSKQFSFFIQSIFLLFHRSHGFIIFMFALGQ